MFEVLANNVKLAKLAKSAKDSAENEAVSATVHNTNSILDEMQVLLAMVTVMIRREIVANNAELPS